MFQLVFVGVVVHVVQRYQIMLPSFTSVITPFTVPLSSQVIADSATGLLFKNKRDRKIVNVNPEMDPGDNTTRVEIATKGQYVQVVLYDHSSRRRL